MKKILSAVVSIVVIVGLVLLGFWIFNSTNMRKLEINVSTGGTVELSANNKKYTIGSGKTESYSFKSGTKLILTAVVNERCEFLNWTINDDTYRSETREFTLDKDTKVKAEFKVSSYRVEVRNEAGEKVISYDYITGNFLESLKTNMASISVAPGHEYVYELDNNRVTADTTIDSDVVLVCKDSLINYTIKFMDGDTQIGETSTYTVESLTKPTAPAVQAPTGYDLSWVVGSTDWETYTLTLGNVVVNTKKTPIVYTIKFMYEDTQQGNDETYTVVNNNKPTPPTIPNIERGYEIVWLVDETLWDEYILTTGDIVVTAEKRAIVYTIKFMDGDTQIGETSTYTVENRDSAKPTAPTFYGYTTTWTVNDTHWEWDTYELTDENIIVHAHKTLIKYGITFKVVEGDLQLAYYEYSIENMTKPDAPVPPNFYVTWKVGDVNWEDYELDSTDLKDILVEGVDKINKFTVEIKNAGNLDGFEAMNLREYTANGSDATFVFTQDDGIITLPAVTSDMYEFMYWVKDNSHGSPVTEIDTSRSSGETITAVWCKSILIKYENLSTSLNEENLAYSHVYIVTAPLDTDTSTNHLAGKVYTKTASGFVKQFNSVEEFINYTNEYDLDRQIVEVTAREQGSELRHVTDLELLTEVASVVSQIASMDTVSKEIEITFTFASV